MELHLAHLMQAETPRFVVDLLPPDPGRFDPLPFITDDLIAALRLHGTAHEREVIRQWVLSFWGWDYA